MQGNAGGGRGQAGPKIDNQLDNIRGLKFMTIIDFWTFGPSPEIRKALLQALHELVSNADTL